MSHGFHLVKGQSGHDMEDYHVAEYRKKKDHVLGLFAIYDGHLGDRVPTYLKDNLFDNILREVCVQFISPPILISRLCLWIMPFLNWNSRPWKGKLVVVKIVLVRIS